MPPMRSLSAGFLLFHLCHCTCTIITCVIALAQRSLSDLSFEPIASCHTPAPPAALHCFFTKLHNTQWMQSKPTDRASQA
eukprot:scaffold22157_cov19-Tisochrysis_lutea.AAC.3